MVIHIHRYAQTDPESFKSCWNCGHREEPTQNPLICNSCNRVKPPGEEALIPGKSDTYFDLFELEPKFNIDNDNLTKKFRALQMNLHPDKWGSRPDSDQRLAAEVSSLLNKAYEALQSPLKRGSYLLELHDMPLQESDRIQEPDFLMQILDLQEELQSGGNPKDIEALARKEMGQIVDRVGGLFADNVSQAREEIIRLRYWQRLLDSALDAQD